MENGSIMIVDDQVNNLSVLEKMLSQKGFTVRPFLQGEMALNSVRTDPPDLILLDIMMPEMDGYEVCEKLKETETTRDIPIIFISAKSVAMDKVKAFNSGGVDYITKPFQLEEVLARIKTHLALRRYQSDIERKNAELNDALKKLKSAQSQLIQSEKMASIGILAAGIAHEINNPINFVNINSKGLKKKLRPIIDLLEQMADTELTSETLAEVLRTIPDLNLPYLLQAIKELTANIETGADRAAEIVAGLQSFSRLDPLKKEETDIHRCLESALIILQNQTKKQITIEKTYGDIPRISGFPGKLTQVFMNIIKNAIDAINSQKGSHHDNIIAIETKAADIDGDQYVQIDISDSGPGISEEIKDRLFDPFFTTKEIGKGTGLGLSIAIGTIESHNGKIDVSNHHEGKGACFHIYLPIQEQTD